MNESLSCPQVMLISCYELGHQPFSLGSTLGILDGEGVKAAAVDLAVEEMSAYTGFLEKVRLVAISAPMHTALRLSLIHI